MDHWTPMMGDRVKGCFGYGRIWNLHPGPYRVTVKWEDTNALPLTAIDVRTLEFIPEMEPRHCPECDEMEFFLEDDYVCGFCRMGS